MSCKTAAQNSYDKIKVICACERVLQAIKNDREEWKKERFTGCKEYWLFGRILTVEEAYERGGEHAYISYICLCARQETVVKRILTAAKFCASDTVYLTQDELSDISGYWEKSDG